MEATHARQEATVVARAAAAETAAAKARQELSVVTEDRLRFEAELEAAIGAEAVARETHEQTLQTRLVRESFKSGAFL